MGIFTIPIVVYSWWSLQDPVIAFHLGTSITLPKIEPLAFYLLGFGMILVLAVLFLVLNRKKLGSYSLLICWLMVSFVLTRLGHGSEYLPILFTALAILAALFLVSIHKQWPRFLFWGVVTICLLSAPLVLWERFSYTMHSSLSFVSSAENEAFDFLDQQRGGILLSNQRIGQLASWKTPFHVVVGQNLMNINGREKRADVNRFFSQPTEEILQKYHPDLVWFDRSQTLPNEPSRIFLFPVFSNAQIRIYRYAPPND